MLNKLIHGDVTVNNRLKLLLSSLAFSGFDIKIDLNANYLIRDSYSQKYMDQAFIYK